VYCEKPIATRLCDAQRMVSACDEAGTLLVVNHNRRFHPNFRRLRDAIADGVLGTVTSVSLRWGSGRLGNVGTHIFDAVRMLTGRKVEAVSGTLDLSGRPDCRGADLHDPGGWGLMRLEGGGMVIVDAADYATVALEIRVNGSEGYAAVGRYEIALEFRDGRSERWPDTTGNTTSMDRAVAEIVAWLDDGTPFPYPAAEAAHVLEAIIAFHVSHERHGAWIDLPLVGTDCEREVRSG